MVFRKTLVKTLITHDSRDLLGQIGLPGVSQQGGEGLILLLDFLVRTGYRQLHDAGAFTIHKYVEALLHTLWTTRSISP